MTLYFIVGLFSIVLACFTERLLEKSPFGSTKGVLSGIFHVLSLAVLFFCTSSITSRSFVGLVVFSVLAVFVMECSILVMKVADRKSYTNYDSSGSSPARSENSDI
jgi:hypothetical protein